MSRRPPRRRPRAVALTVAAILLGIGGVAAGCGDDSDSGSTTTGNTSAWVSGFCSSITEWSGQVKASVDSLRGGNISKNSLSAAAGDITDATKTLESELKSLPPLETEAGAQAQDAVTQLSGDVTTAENQVQSAAEGASGVSETLTAAGTATAAISTLAGQVQSTVTTLSGLDPEDELKSAFDSEPACEPIQQELNDLKS